MALIVFLIGSQWGIQDFDKGGPPKKSVWMWGGGCVCVCVGGCCVCCVWGWGCRGVEWG